MQQDYVLLLCLVGTTRTALGLYGYTIWQHQEISGWYPQRVVLGKTHGYLFGEFVEKHSVLILSPEIIRGTQIDSNLTKTSHGASCSNVHRWGLGSARLKTIHTNQGQKHNLCSPSPNDPLISKSMYDLLPYYPLLLHPSRPRHSYSLARPPASKSLSLPSFSAEA